MRAFKLKAGNIISRGFCKVAAALTLSIALVGIAMSVNAQTVITPPTIVSNSDGTLTISPVIGSVTASLNLAHANTWTGQITASGGFVGEDSGTWNGSGIGGILALGVNGAAGSQGTADIFANPVVTPTIDVAQYSTGTTLMLSNAASVAVGQIVQDTTHSYITTGTQVASVVTAAQATGTASSGASGQKTLVLSAVTGTPSNGQACRDTTHPGYIGQDNTVNTYVSGTKTITFYNNISTSVVSGDNVVCDPTVTLTAATTTAVPAADNIPFYANHTSLSSASAAYVYGDASIVGNVNVSGGVYIGSTILTSFGSNGLNINAGAGEIAISDLESLYSYIKVYNGALGFSSSGLLFPNNKGPLWSTTTNYTGTTDVGFDRAGTNALELNNGTVGNASGTLNLATLNAGTNVAIDGCTIGSLAECVGSSTPLTVSAAGAIDVQNTTASSSTTTGAIIDAGGMGVAGSVNIGGGLAIAANQPVTANSANLGQIVYYYATGVNFNSVGDTAFSITLPNVAVGYRLNNVIVYNASANVSNAVFGIYTSTGGGGTALLSPTSCTVTTGSANTNNNAQTVTGDSFLNNGNEVYNYSTLYFRITTANGSAGTASVLIAVNVEN